MPHGSWSLREAAAAVATLELACEKCGRRGRYRVDRLIEQHGADVSLPDLRHRLAQCPREKNWSDPCGVHYLDWPSFEARGPEEAASTSG